MGQKEDQQDDTLKRVVEALGEEQPFPKEDEEARQMAQLLYAAGRNCADPSSSPFDSEEGWERFAKSASSLRRRRLWYLYVGGVAISLVGAAASVGLWLLLSHFFLSGKKTPVTLFAAEEVHTEVHIYRNGELLSLSGDPIDLTDGYGSSDRYVVETPAGSHLRLLLPDSTHVSLNAGSRLSYHFSPSEGLRKVTLEGEGFFDVKRDTLHPFAIEVGNVKAEVLGTSFNIRHYEREQLHITLLQGSLAVETAEQERRILKPGEDAELQTDGHLKIRESRTDTSILWRDGYFAFDDVPLSGLMCEIGRWYNLTILSMNEPATSRRVHFKCKRSLGAHEIVALLNELGGFKLAWKDEQTIVIK